MLEDFISIISEIYWIWVWNDQTCNHLQIGQFCCYLLRKASRLCTGGRARGPISIPGEHHGLFYPNLRQKQSSYYLKQHSGIYSVGKFLSIWEILLLFHKNVIYTVKYHGLCSRRPFVSEKRCLRHYFFKFI
jgi:hypothetical protein